GPSVAVAVPDVALPALGLTAGINPQGPASGGGLVFMAPQPGATGSGLGGGDRPGGDGASIIGNPAGGLGGGGAGRGTGTGSAPVSAGLAIPEPMRLDLRLPTEQTAPA